MKDLSFVAVICCSFACSSETPQVAREPNKKQGRLFHSEPRAGGWTRP